MSHEPFICDLDPDTKTTLKIYLFKKVSNVEDLRNKVVKGGWNCSMIKPSLILDTFQVAVAANRAVLAKKSQSMVTKTVYSEILYNLALTKNISQSLCKFGIEKETSLLVCFLVTPDIDDSTEILKQIDGEMCPITELDKFTDMSRLKTAYKVNNVKNNVDLLDMIVTKMVTKDFVSY